MRGRDHQELNRLITRHESHHYAQELSMNVLAVVGLISFGLMAGPIFFTHIPTYLASTEAPAPTEQKRFLDTPVMARSAVVYDLTTHTVLYGKNETAVRPLASLTKLLTVYTALTQLSKNTPVVITENALAPEGDSGLNVGETISLGALERLALVASSNDAAQAIALAYAERTSKSSTSLMASAISSLGLSDVRATNPTGLDVSSDISGGYGSAISVATLAEHILLLDPALALATTRPSVTVRSIDAGAHTLHNTNQDMRSIPNPLLSKTGFTDLAGGNLVVVLDVGINHPVAIVVMGSTKEGRFEDVLNLVDNTLDYFAPARLPSQH